MPTPPLRHVLIATVGRTEEPIAVSIVHHAPDGVVLIASQESQGIAGKIAEEFRKDVVVYTRLIDAPEELHASYQAGLGALRKALEWEAQAITADLTGGTKPMVAGLTLALSGRGVTFSYVGGSERDEYGRVRSGSEQVRALEDPTVRYAVREWAAFTRAWNGWRFQEAKDLLEQVLERPQSASGERFHRHLLAVTEALIAWDRFHHQEALAGLEEHLEPALAIAEAWRHGAKVRVLAELEGHRQRLEQLVAKADAPSRELLGDLLANAARRADAGRYDDALARLYRAVEMAVEVDLFERHGVDLRRPDRWPGDYPKALRERAGSLRGLKETLELAFDIDVHRGETGTLAQRLRADYQGSLRELLERRHASILAHGRKPVRRDDYLALGEYLLGYGLEPAAAFPKW